MFGQQWYFGTLRKYHMYFGALFNDIYIDRTLDDGTTGARIKVPLTLAPKEKVLVRLNQDPTANRQAEVVLPAMSFELVSVRYNEGRKLGSVNKITRKAEGEPNRVKYQYTPVPYDIVFNLYVYVKNAEDGSKIIEQILPMFRPEFSATLELVPEMGVKQDIPIVLDSVEPYSAWADETYESHRAYIWTLSFTLQGYFYGPVKSGPIIKFSKATYYASTETTQDPFFRVTETPGLTVDGEPTTDPDESIDPNVIEIDDDWGYAQLRESL